MPNQTSWFFRFPECIIMADEAVANRNMSFGNTTHGHEAVTSPPWQKQNVQRHNKSFSVINYSCWRTPWIKFFPTVLRQNGESTPYQSTYKKSPTQNIPQNWAMIPLARYCVDRVFKKNCRDVKKVKQIIQASTVFPALTIGKLCHCAKKKENNTNLLPSFCYIHKKTLQVHKLLTDRHLASHIHTLAVMLTSYCGRNKYLQPQTSISLHTKPCK